MAVIIEKWLLNKIGVNIPVSPEILGEACFDGTLFAKILYKYNICSHEYTKLIWRTQKYEVAYSNLKKLCIWFKLLGINYDDTFLSQIAAKKGSTSLRLLYELFIRLENKERLKYLDWQSKERLLSQSTDLFKVERALERMPEVNVTNEKEYLKEYYKEAKNVIQICSKKEKKILEKRMEECKKRKEITRHQSNQFNIEAIFHKKENSDTAEFERLTKQLNDDFKALCNKEDLIDCQLNTYVSLLKVRRREKEAKEIMDESVGRLLIDDTWKTLLEEQDAEERDVLARKLLKQSEYEKQMVSRLRACRFMYKRFVDNKKRINELEEQDHFNWTPRIKETVINSLEKSRLLHLHNRLYKNKQKERYNLEFKCCKMIVNDIINLAILCSEYRELYGKEPPKSTRIDWKVFFLTGLPLLEEEVGKEKTAEEEEIILEAVEKTLGDLDLYRYLHLIGPWNPKTLPDLKETHFERLEHIGYLVHKLLDQKYNYDLAFGVPADLPNHKVRVLLKPINNAYIIDKLRELLAKSKIAIIDLNSAINFVINEYRGESIDNERPKVISQSLSTSKFPKQTASPTKAKRRSLLKEKIALKESETDLKSKANNVGTQYPEPEPLGEAEESKPRENMAFCLGRLVTAYLAAGISLPDVLACRVLVEYIKSLANYEGWVLMNFPQSLIQVAVLEYMFTGREAPFTRTFNCNMWFEIRNELKDFGLPDYLNDTDSIDLLDSILAGDAGKWADSFDEREKFKHPSIQDIIIWKRSELLPKPYPDIPLPFFSSYFTKVIQAECKSSLVEEDLSSSKQKSKDKENTTKFCGSVEDFYYTLGIGHQFPYDAMNPQTLMRLGGFILGSSSNEGKSSWENAVDLFGFEHLIQIKPKRGSVQYDATLGDKSIACVSTIDPQYEIPHLEGIALDLHKEEIEEHKFQNELYRDTFKHFSSKAADSFTDSESEDFCGINDLNIPREFVVPLASVWETTEFYYKFNMNEIFNLLRVIESQLLPYRNYVLNIANKCTKLCDDRSELVTNFQIMFNGISESQRSVKCVKKELHCRAFELQSRLWRLSDVKKILSEKTLNRIKSENWLFKRGIEFLRAYSCLLQTEMDRCVDTLQLFMDAVNLSLVNQLSGRRLVKIIMPSFEWSKLIHNVKSFSKESTKSTKRETHSKKNSLHPNMFDESVSIHCEDMVGQGVSALLGIFEVTIDALKLRVGSFKEKAKLSLEEAIETCFNKDKTSLKNSAHLSILPTDIITTIENENDRVLFRINLISAKTSKTLKDLDNLINSVFVDFKKDIVHQYHMEMQAIEKLYDLICLAIEEEVKIQPKIILSGDSLSIDPCSLMFPCQSPPPPSRLEERSVGWRFTLAQLGNLMVQLKRVAPMGLKKNSLAAILQDMALTGHELGHPYLPPSWSSLSDKQVAEQVDRWFGARAFVSWKEVVLFGLDLDYPTLAEILDMKAEFSQYDFEHSELVTKEHYYATTLWFEKAYSLSLTDDLRRSKAKRLLFEMFKVNRDRINYTCLLMSVARDSDPILGMVKALAATESPLVISSKVDKFLEDEQIEQETEKFKIVIRILQDIIFAVCTIREVVITEWTSAVGVEDVVPEQILSSSTIPSPDSRETISSDILSQNTSPALRGHELRNAPIWTSDVHLDSVLSVFAFHLCYNAASTDQHKELLKIRRELISIFKKKGQGYIIKLYTLVEDTYIKNLISSFRLFYAINITQYLSLIHTNLSELQKEYTFKNSQV